MNPRPTGPYYEISFWLKGKGPELIQYVEQLALETEGYIDNWDWTIPDSLEFYVMFNTLPELRKFQKKLIRSKKFPLKTGVVAFLSAEDEWVRDYNWRQS